MLVPQKGTSLATKRLVQACSFQGSLRLILSLALGDEWERTLGTSMWCNVSHERHHFVVKSHYS